MAQPFLAVLIDFHDLPVPPKVSGIGRFRLPFGVVGAYFLILFDHGTPTNDPLLNAAQAAAPELLLTTDSRIRDRQNLAGRKIALIVLTGAAKWSRVGLHLERVAAVGERGHEASRTIALLLTVIALRPLISPDTSASAQGSQKPISAKISWEYKWVNRTRGSQLLRESWSEDGYSNEITAPSSWFAKAQELGPQGWELIEYSDAGGTLVFKRPKP